MKSNSQKNKSSLIKSNAFKITISVLLVALGIAAIATCSYFLASYSQSIIELANLPISDPSRVKFWEKFGFIVGIIIGIGVFAMGALIIANILYMYSTNKTLLKSKDSKKKGKTNG